MKKVKRHWLWISAVLLSALLFVTIMGGWVLTYLSSESFHGLVEDHAGATIGGKVDLSPFQWDGNGAYGQSFRFLGGENSKLGRIDAQELHARWDWWTWLSGTWRLEELSIESLSASFIRKPLGAKEPLGGTRTERNAVAWIGAIFPTRFEFCPLRVSRANVQFEQFKLNGSSLEIQQDSGIWNFSGVGGIVLIPAFPPLAVESFTARFQDPELSLLDSSLKIGSKGQLKISGTWPKGLKLNGSGISLQELPDWPWKKAVCGYITGTAVILPGEASGRIEVTEGSMEAPGLLGNLASLTGIRSLQRLSISAATGRFYKSTTSWKWSEVFVESEGLLCIKGGFEVAADRRLSGTLQLGISDQIAAKIPGRELVFQVARDSYVWTPVVLGGTLDAPTEDLSPRLAVALGGAVIESVQPLLDAVPDNARDAVGETLDTFLNFLGR